jgi:hypothetical protein
VTALDDNNLTVPTYSGTVHFTSTDPLAVLPPDSTLLQGTGTFSATLATVGSQTITARDSVSAAIAGTSTPINVLFASQPFTVSVSPNLGEGLTQAFTFISFDPAGYSDLDVVNILINNSLDGRNACYLAYSRPLNVLYLVNDAGTALLPALAPNSSGSMGNSQCSVTGADFSVTSLANRLQLDLKLTFSGSFTGHRIVWVAARGAVLGNSGWRAGGQWHVPGDPLTAPEVASLGYRVSPATTPPAPAGGAPNAFLTVKVPLEWLNHPAQSVSTRGIVNVLINNFLDGRQACYFAYIYDFNHLYLVNDAGTAILPDVVADGVTRVSNSQCSVAASSFVSGDTIILSLSVAFFTPFRGSHAVYAAARNDLNLAQNTGWQPVGVWVVQ